MRTIFVFLLSLLVLFGNNAGLDPKHVEADNTGTNPGSAVGDTFRKDAAAADLENITDFYYTLDSSTAIPYYQRYHFYRQDDACFFYHETREGGSWPQTEENITARGTVQLTEEDWQTFCGLLDGGTICMPEADPVDGDAGPWTYIYRGHGQEEYIFPDYGARLVFEEYCEGLK